jgi:hypothetical protein
MSMRLSSPSLMTVFVSFVLALASVLSALGLVQVPVIGGAAFVSLLLAYVLLLLGILIRGL